MYLFIALFDGKTRHWAHTFLLHPIPEVPLTEYMLCAEEYFRTRYMGSCRRWASVFTLSINIMNVVTCTVREGFLVFAPPLCSCLPPVIGLRTKKIQDISSFPWWTWLVKVLEWTSIWIHSMLLCICVSFHIKIRIVCTGHNGSIDVWTARLSARGRTSFHCNYYSLNRVTHRKFIPIVVSC